MRIVIVNACVSLVDNATAQKWCDAIQRQVANDFAPIWNESAVLHYIGDSTTEQPLPTDGVIRLVATSSTDGALGTHWLAGTQQPVGEVGAQTCLDDGVAISSCLSHEILECILDPMATAAMQVGKSMLALEACDRTEDSDSTYTIDGVSLENFSLPSAFLDGAPGPWDFRKKCSTNNVLANGYQLSVDLGSGTWTQITGALARRSKQKAGPSSRRASRMVRAGVDPASLVLVSA